MHSKCEDVKLTQCTLSTVFCPHFEQLLLELILFFVKFCSPDKVSDGYTLVSQ